MASPLTTREIITIIGACALFMSIGVFLLYRFFLTPVERRLRHWASTLNCQLVRYNEPMGLLDQPLSWFWSPWGVWRVTVRDRAGLKRVALVRLRTLRTDPSPIDIRWEDDRTDASTLLP